MSWYHVIIVQNSTSAEEVRLDYTLAELQQRVVDPYRSGRPLTVNGKTFAPNEIERVTITKSDDVSSNVRRTVQISPQARWLTTPKAIDKHLVNSAENVTDEFIDGPPGSALERAPQSGQALRPPANTREVFVVHGRNLAARDALFEFLRAVDLHPLEWSESVRATGKPTPYIGEILDVAFSRAHAVVVIFTPDDEARLREPLRVANDPPHETQLTGQARPNVLFEAGMAMARSQDRTVLIELGNLRPFSDIGGRHTVRLDNSSQQRQELAQRLEAAGCPVNREGKDWYSAGDFEGAIASLDQGSPETNDDVEQQPATDGAPSLSEEARDLLIEAAMDTAGMIVMIRSFGGLRISTNGKAFGERGNIRSEARWKQAIKELLNQGFIEDVKGKGEVFEVTHEGFEVAGSLGTSR